MGFPLTADLPVGRTATFFTTALPVELPRHIMDRFAPALHGTDAHLNTRGRSAITVRRFSY